MLPLVGLSAKWMTIERLNYRMFKGLISPLDSVLVTILIYNAFLLEPKLCA